MYQKFLYMICLDDNFSGPFTVLVCFIFIDVRAVKLMCIQ